MFLAALLLASCEKQTPPSPPRSASRPAPPTPLPLPHFDPSRDDHQRIEQAIRKALSRPQGPLDAASLSRIRHLGHQSLASQQLSDLRPLTGLKGLHELWLQGNLIKELSPLAELAELKTLWLDGNQFADLRPLASLGSLRELSLGGNQISNLATLNPPPQLQSLHLPNNRITSLESLASFPRLQTLDLSANSLATPIGLERCPRLEHLKLAYNQVTNLSSLNSLHFLKTLSLDNNPLGNLAGLESCGALEILTASHAGISSLGPLTNARALRELDLSSNLIESLKPLAGHAALEKINLTHNPIATLEGLKHCSSLRRLECQFNQVADLSPLTDLTRMEELFLNGNPINHLNPLAGLTNLHTLHLSNADLTSMAPLAQLHRLRHLDLHNNRLTDLDPLKQLPTLFHLNLSHNNIADLTPLTTLTNLMELRLKGNRLHTLPPLRRMDKLAHLDLAANQVTNLAPLAGLKNLRTLYLNQNQLSQLHGIEHCTRLEILNLADNPVTDLAPLSALSQLRQLFLDASAVSSLAPLARLEKLARLEVSGVSEEKLESLRKDLPQCAIQKVGLILNTPTASPGYLLLAPISSTSTFLINRNGRVVHEWPSLYRPHLAVYLMEDGSLLRTCQPYGVSSLESAPPLPGGGLQRISWDGKVLWDCHAFQVHHDIEPLPNGNLLAIVNETVQIPDALAAGRDPATVGATGLMPDVILEIQPNSPRSGKIVWEWHAWDHIVQDVDPDKKNFGAVAAHPDRLDLNHLGVAPSRNIHDWLHLNSVDYHPRLDQILLSSHRFNEIWIIDHALTSDAARGPQGRLLYRWGNPLAYKKGTDQDRQLFRQHDAQWLPNGNILLFNNGQRRVRPYSSIVEIKPPVNTQGQYQKQDDQPYGPAEPVWAYSAPKKVDFYSRNISGVQRLPNGHTLICSGAPGRIFEITPEGEIVWEYRNPHPGRSGGQWGTRSGRRRPAGERPVFRAFHIPPNHPALKGKTFNRVHAD